MVGLNFPSYCFRYRIKKDKAFIFCLSRKKFLRLTPEEWVRQHVLHYLTTEKKYPLIAIKIEAFLLINGLKKRADLIVYQREKPFILIECKAPHISLTQKTLDQISRYNFELHCPYLMLTNGIQHVFCHINELNGRLCLIDALPKSSALV